MLRTHILFAPLLLSLFVEMRLSWCGSINKTALEPSHTCMLVAITVRGKGTVAAGHISMNDCIRIFPAYAMKFLQKSIDSSVALPLLPNESNMRPEYKPSTPSVTMMLASIVCICKLYTYTYCIKVEHAFVYESSP